jgi:photosystem II stability/assembly factor-like uncharacterized protein
MKMKQNQVIIVILLLLISYSVYPQYSSVQVPFGGQASAIIEIKDNQSNSNHIFAEVVGKGIFKLSDNVWESGSIYNDTLFFKLIKSNNILLASYRNKGLFESTDFGETWNPTLGVDSSEIILNICTDNKANYYAVSTRGKICISNDDRKSWKKFIMPDTAIGRDIIVMDNGKIICASNKGVLGSSDNGISWEILDTTIIRTKNTKDIFVADNGWIFLATQSGLYRSKDDGTTWEELNNGIYYDNINCVYEVNPNLLIIGTGIGTYYSTDYGDSWTEINKNTNVVNVTGFALAGTDIIASASYGIFKSDFTFSSWTDFNEGFSNLVLSKFLPYFKGREINYLLASENKILFQAGVENKWSMKFDGITFNAISQSPWGFIYLSSGMGGILRSTDYGQSFEQFYSNNSRGINAFAYDSKGNVYGALNSPTAVVTKDHSETWEVLNKGIDSLRGLSIALDSKDNKYLIATKTSRYLLFSQDNSPDWKYLSFPTPIPMMTQVSIGPDDAVYVLSDSKGIVKLNSKLDDFTSFFNGYRLRKLMINRFNQMLTYSRNSVYVYDNGNWDSTSYDFNGFPGDILDAYFANDNGIYILTRNSIFKSNKVTAVEINPDSDLLIELFPNPVNESLSLRLKNNTTSIESIDIIDYEGKKCKQINTIHEEQIYIGDLLRGIYIVNVRTSSGKQQTGKFIKF